MLKVNLTKIVKTRGILYPYSFFKNLGFSAGTASAMNRGEYNQMNWATMEKLCLHLRCTPNDLFEWVPDEEIPDDHPMHQICKDRHDKLNSILQNLSITELENLIDKVEEACGKKKELTSKLERLLEKLSPEQIERLDL